MGTLPRKPTFHTQREPTIWLTITNDIQSHFFLNACSQGIKKPILSVLNMQNHANQYAYTCYSFICSSLFYKFLTLHGRSIASFVNNTLSSEGEENQSKRAHSRADSATAKHLQAYRHYWLPVIFEKNGSRNHKMNSLVSILWMKEEIKDDTCILI